MLLSGYTTEYEDARQVLSFTSGGKGGGEGGGGALAPFPSLEIWFVIIHVYILDECRIFLGQD